MNRPPREVLSAVLRADLGSFLRKSFGTLAPGQAFMPNWHVDAIIHVLERFRRGEITRLIINMPPRSLKSMIGSVVLPAFMHGHDPTERIICVSYSADLAGKFANDYRTLIGTQWYRDLFPHTRIGAYKDSEAEIELSRRGFRLATSVGGTLTGRGANTIIIDDPLKAQDAMSENKREACNTWFGSTLISRLDDKRTGRIAVIMQRVHMDDLTGHLLETGQSWHVLNLSAIAGADEVVEIGRGRVHQRKCGDLLFPERETQAILADLKRTLGSDAFAAQYLQEPVPPGGLMIKRDWIRTFKRLPDGPTELFQSWDTAARGGPENDWSVCTTWLRHISNWYLTDVWRGKVNYPDLKAKVFELWDLFKPRKVIVEQAGTALALLDELRMQVPGLIGYKPRLDKITRMSACSAMFEAGQVFFPSTAPWLPDLERELFSFPGGRHDDQVDSISQMFDYHRSNPNIWYDLMPEVRRQRLISRARADGTLPPETEH